MGWGSRKTHVSLERFTYMQAWRPFTSAGFTCRTFIEQQWCTKYMDMESLPGVLSFCMQLSYISNVPSACRSFVCLLSTESKRASLASWDSQCKTCVPRARPCADRQHARRSHQSSGQWPVETRLESRRSASDSRRSHGAYCKRSMFSVESGRQKERTCFAIAKLSMSCTYYS